MPSCASNATDETVNLQLRTVHTCQESTSSNEKSPISKETYILVLRIWKVGEGASERAEERAHAYQCGAANCSAVQRVAVFIDNSWLVGGVRQRSGDGLARLGSVMAGYGSVRID